MPPKGRKRGTKAAKSRELVVVESDRCVHMSFTWLLRIFTRSFVLATMRNLSSKMLSHRISQNERLVEVPTMKNRMCMLRTRIFAHQPFYYSISNIVSSSKKQKTTANDNDSDSAVVDSPARLTGTKRRYVNVYRCFSL